LINWNTPQLLYRIKHGGGRKQALARAIGVKPGLCVVDAMAGFGRDAFVLAALGCQLHLIESSPAIFRLLEDAWMRAQNDAGIADIARRITLYSGNSLERLPEIANQENIDVVYLDPMYPKRQKSAAVKQDMQVLQSLADPFNEEEAKQLLRLSRQVAKKRVVVKRPLNAPLIDLDSQPSGQVKMTHTRFDIYSASLS